MRPTKWHPNTQSQGKGRTAFLPLDEIHSQVPVPYEVSNGHPAIQHHWQEDNCTQFLPNIAADDERKQGRPLHRCKDESMHDSLVTRSKVVVSICYSLRDAGEGTDRPYAVLPIGRAFVHEHLAQSVHACEGVQEGTEDVPSVRYTEGRGPSIDVEVIGFVQGQRSGGFAVRDGDEDHDQRDHPDHAVRLALVQHFLDPFPRDATDPIGHGRPLAARERVHVSELDIRSRKTSRQPPNWSHTRPNRREYSHGRWFVFAPTRPHRAGPRARGFRGGGEKTRGVRWEAGEEREIRADREVELDACAPSSATGREPARPPTRTARVLPARRLCLGFFSHLARDASNLRLRRTRSRARASLRHQPRSKSVRNRTRTSLSSSPRRSSRGSSATTVDFPSRFGCGTWTARPNRTRDRRGRGGPVPSILPGQRIDRIESYR
eukprot:scaffold1401_cov330-Pavlova_lutheri.AAC.145